MLGYYEDAEATAAAIDEDGWFNSGDIGYMDEDGFIYITGRSKNVIVTQNGKNIYPEEIETLLSKVEEIKECMVYGKEVAGEKELIITARVIPDYERIEELHGADLSEDEVYKVIWEQIKKVNRKLSNYKTIKKSIIRLKNLRKMEEDGTFDLLPKKEVASLQKEISNLEKNLGGIKDMNGLPSCVFIVDPKKEHNAIEEARKLGIPIVAIVDTNCDPDEVDYIIPGNDDAIRGIKLISSVLADAVIEAKGGVQLTDGTEEESESEGDVEFVKEEE